MLEIIKIRKDISWIIYQIKCLFDKRPTATAWSEYHTLTSGGKYKAGTVVWYEGCIYKAKVDNPSILPTNSSFWTKVGAGDLLEEAIPDWIAPVGTRSFIKNKPVIEGGIIVEDDPFFKSSPAFDITPEHIETLNNTSGINTGDQDLPTNTSQLINDGEDGVNPFISLVDLYPGNILLNGGYYHISGYQYFVWADRYIIDGVVYTDYISATVTLNTADPNYDRIDLIVINNNQTITVIQGTVAQNPTAPLLDTSTQLQVTFILVTSNTVSPPEVVREQVYYDNAGEPGEWTIDSLSATVNPDDIVDSESGIKNIKFTLSPTGHKIAYKNNVAIVADGTGNLVFKIKFLSLVAHRIQILVVDSTTGSNYQAWITPTNFYGIDVTNTTTWQTCIIPTTPPYFSLAEFDTLIFVNNKGGASFRIDDVFFQTGTQPIEPEIKITKTSQLINDGADGTSTYVEHDELGVVATSNSYNDLDDKPDLSSLHTHANKTLLDSYTQTEANLADAVAKKHTHSNKEALDLVSGTNTGDQDLSGLVTDEEFALALGDKVDKVPGERLINASEIENLANQSGVNTGDQVLPTSTKELINEGSDGLSTYVELDELNLLLPIIPGDTDTALYSGDAIWQTGFTYFVWVDNFKIDGLKVTTYYSATKVLDALGVANPTWSRIDIFVIQVIAEVYSIQVIQGTAAETPVAPTLNASTQLEISRATVFAGATTPVGVAENIVYKEGNVGEWARSLGHASIQQLSTNAPITGLYSILHTNTPQDAQLRFMTPTPIFTSSEKMLTFDIKLQTVWEWKNSNRTTIDINLGVDGVNYTDRIRLGSDFGFGFDGYNITTVQTIAIRLNKFGSVFNKNTFNTITFKYKRTESDIFRVDNIRIIDAGNNNTSPDVPVKTSQLINDGENGTSTYIEYVDFDTTTKAFKETVSTGIISGGALSINVGDNTKFDISAGRGYVVDNTIYPAVITEVSWGNLIAQTLINLATSFATDIAIDINGNIIQQDSITDEELRSLIFLGGIDHSNQINISSVFSIQVPVAAPANSLQELARAIGDINLIGNVYAPNGANLNIDKSGGQVFSYGRNNVNNKVNPHKIIVNAQVIVSFSYVFNDGFGNGVFTAPTTSVNPNNYDSGTGVLSLVPTNNWAIQRILFFPNGNKTFIQYGTSTYNKKEDALNAVPRADFPPLTGIRTAVVRGYLIVRRGESDLSSSNTVFLTADRFGIVAGLDGGSSLVSWGNITGTLADQIDLQEALDEKENIVNKSQDIEGDKLSTIKYASVKAIYDWAVSKFQALLVSGTNIKTINNESILGSGNIVLTTEPSLPGGNKVFPFTSLTTWTVNHNLGVQYPKITCVDENDEEFIPLTIDFVSTSQTIITHSSPQSGKAIADTGATAILGDNTVANNNLTAQLSEREIMLDTQIDWSTAVAKTRTISVDTTFTDVNLPQGNKTHVIELHFIGDFAITFPIYWVWKGGVYDGTVSNMIVADCLNGNAGSEIVNYTIIPNA